MSWKDIIKATVTDSKGNKMIITYVKKGVKQDRIIASYDGSKDLIEKEPRIISIPFGEHTADFEEDIACGEHLYNEEDKLIYG